MTVLEFFNVFNLFYKQPPDTMVWSLGSLYVLRYLQYEKNLSIHVVQKQHQWNYIFCNLKIASDTFSPKRCFRTSPLETLLLLNEYWASHKRPLTLRVLGVERKREITFTDVVRNYYLFSTWVKGKPSHFVNFRFATTLKPAKRTYIPPWLLRNLV